MRRAAGLWMRSVGAMRKIFLALLFAGCGVTGPEVVGLEARYRVEVGEEKTVVFFEATAPDSLYWKLVWVDFNWPKSYLFDYGHAVGYVEVPLVHQTGFDFWMDFYVWNHSDTVVVTYMSLGG